MLCNEQLTYISAAGKIVLALNGKISPYWWTGESGLSGLMNSIYTYQGAGQDGESVMGSTVQARYVTLEGVIIANPEQARRELLRVINLKYAGKIIYTNGSVTRYINCLVEQAPIISNAAIPQFQFVLRCPYPFLRDGDGSAQHAAEIAQWLPLLVFDAEDGFEIPEDGFEFGVRSPMLAVNIPYAGDVPASVMIEFKAIGDTSNPSLTNVYSQEVISLTIDMAAGDVIRVTTGYGIKGAQLTRNGIATNVYGAINKGSTWLQLAIGDNLLRYDATDPDHLEVTIYYDIAFVGV